MYSQHKQLVKQNGNKITLKPQKACNSKS